MRIAALALAPLWLVIAIGRAALADPVPSPAPNPAPVPQSSPTATAQPAAPASPAPTSGPGWHNSVDGFVSLVDQATGGSGAQPPEGAGFANGSPLSPNTPYDTFASVPTTPGVGGLGQFELTTQYVGKHLNATMVSGLGYATGSTTNNTYWTEPLMQTLNPHLGSQALPYAIRFPTHAGQDDGQNTRGSILSGAIGSNDGSFMLRGGWFDLTQSDRFVFVQPPLTSLTPQIGLQTAESLGDGPRLLDGWPAAAPGSSLQGIDLTLHDRSTTLEVTNAALPSLPGTSARMTLGSVVLDRGGGTRFSADFLHLATSGDLINTTTLFGQDAVLNAGPQGELPTSMLGGQTQTIAGLRGSFNVGGTFWALVEAGQAWYDANHVLLPGTARPGGFYHLALTHRESRATTSVEAFRFEPRYATAILPYGAPENIWSSAWSWPGVWLKSTYQLSDNTQIGANRQGYRLHYALRGERFDVRASYASWDQIDEATTTNANQTGFVEGFFLPQLPGQATLGHMHQYAAWLAWHPSIADLSLDYVDDTMHRDFQPGQPQDSVTLNTPQIVISASRAVSKTALVSIGYGRYAQRGSWAQGSLTNVDYGENVTFAGTQVTESPHAMVLVQVRSTAFAGLPSSIAGPSPDYHATSLIVEQRFHV
ncbi:MAG: hypothetical protein JOZ28_03770 [Candidatus Eremiobacteraeota bacterium]|nr:hypothetical protein [Candidatus Eremiobacteraeota bacterium]